MVKTHNYYTCVAAGKNPAEKEFQPGSNYLRK